MLLLFELTHDYFIIIPTLASVGISYWVASFPMAALLRPLSPLLRLAGPWLPHMQPPPAAAALPAAGGTLRGAALGAAQDPAAVERSVAAAEQPRNGARLPAQAAAAAMIGDLAAMGIAPDLAASGAAQGNGASLRRRSGRPGSVVATLGAGHAASVRFSSGVLSFPGQAAAGGNSTNGAAVQQAGRQAIGNLPLAGRQDEVEDLTVLCALRQACVMLPIETTLAEALEVQVPCHCALPPALAPHCEAPCKLAVRHVCTAVTVCMAHCVTAPAERLPGTGNVQ